MIGIHDAYTLSHLSDLVSALEGSDDCERPGARRALLDEMELVCANANKFREEMNDWRMKALALAEVERVRQGNTM